MDFERGMEFARKPARESQSREAPQKDSSYSEEEQAKVIEGMVVDIKQAGNKRTRLLPEASRKEKIITSYRHNLEKIFQLVEAISVLEGKNERQQEQIVEEIKNLRRIQEELLNALILEQKGTLSQESISKDAWNLIA